MDINESIISEYREATQATKIFYDYFAKYYDEFVPTQERNDERIKKLVSYISRKTSIQPSKLDILELGCGNGSYAIRLSAFVHKVVGFDVSTKMREIAISKEGYNSEKLDFKLTDWVSGLKSYEQEFDCILCIGNSITHNPQITLPIIFKAVFKALKPGGLFYLNGRRIENELSMSGGIDRLDNNLCKSSGPTLIPGKEMCQALRFMYMNKVCKNDNTIIAFYTYDNYESDGRRFVCHRIKLNNNLEIETKKPTDYDMFSTKVFYIYQDKLEAQLNDAGFVDIKEESFEGKDEGLKKNWYIAARKR